MMSITNMFELRARACALAVAVTMVGCAADSLTPEDVEEELQDAEEVEVGLQESALVIAQRVAGTLVCASPGAGDLPLVGVRIELEGLGTVTTGGGGAFVISRAVESRSVGVRLRHDVTVGSGVARTRVQVMDDVRGVRSDRVAIAGTVRATTPRTLDLGTVRFSGDCEILRIGLQIARDFHGVRGAAMPGGGLAFMRRAGVWGTTPYAFFDYVDLATNFLAQYPSRSSREFTLFHEAAHVVRDLYDGDGAHWHWDNTRIRYARVHNGLEISEDAYAFHEGWAGYWSSARNRGRAKPSGGSYAPIYMDWVENLVAGRLLDLSACVGDRAMLEALERNRGAVHSLYRFEQALCPTTTSCCGLRRPAPAPCPPQYFNDGLTCRLDNIRAKPSYGRGVGTIPNQCGEGRENNAGLCYPRCNDGYSGVGPVCWQRCPEGYHDDGAFCRRDAHIFGSDNSACPWYDKCGLVTARGCSHCPAGYHNDGCTCRRDAHIFAKNSYGRGVGTIPGACASGREKDAGLCYPPCNAGYHGVGPVCWGSCPAGFDDHGATCYRAPHIISRYP